MTNMKSVLAEVANMNVGELNALVAAITARRQVIGSNVRQQLTVGAEVSFVSGRSGKLMKGVVQKIGPKNVIVDCGPAQVYRVPAAMLRVA